jgi:hypothetical protein
VAAHEADIESDLSAIHRIDDMHTEPADRIFRLARRLSHYPGCVQSAIAREARHRGAPGRAGDGIDWIPATRDAVRGSALNDVLSC